MQFIPSRASIALAWALLWRTWFWSGIAGVAGYLALLLMMYLALGLFPQQPSGWPAYTGTFEFWSAIAVTFAASMLPLAFGLFMACRAVLRKRHFRTFRIACVRHGIPGTGRAHAWHMARWLAFWIIVYSAPAVVPAFALGVTQPENPVLPYLRLAGFWLQLLALHWAVQPSHPFGRGRLVVTPQHP